MCVIDDVMLCIYNIESSDSNSGCDMLRIRHPAKAGIQGREGYRSITLDPRFRGDDEGAGMTGKGRSRATANVVTLATVAATR